MYQVFTRMEVDYGKIIFNGKNMNVTKNAKHISVVIIIIIN